MLKFKKKLIIIAASIMMAIAVVVVCCIAFREKDDSSNVTQDIQKIVRENISFTIGDVEDPNATTTTANVTVSAPDLVAIYKKAKEENPEKKMSLEDVCSIVSKYAKATEYRVEHEITAEVRKEGDAWTLVSDECIQNIISDMASQLLVQRVNDEEHFEIETIDIGRIAE